MKVIELRTDDNGITQDDDGIGFFLTAGISAEKKLNLKPDTTYIGPLWEVPKGYRLFTEEEKQKYKKEELWEYLKYSVDCGKCFKTNFPTQGYGRWGEDVIYIIREDWTPEQHIEVTVTVNGKQVDPSKLSKETWENLRD